VGEKLKSLAPPEPAHVNRLIRSLDDDGFRERDRAEKELRGLGLWAESALRSALKTKISAETERKLKELHQRIVRGDCN
ncbi:hypothetical protein, partial [Escherichia coli]|uniref:hypothetical protein n=1 Tax=Escherichia coli TaxID=562 RepID=UPI0028DDFF6F